MLFLSASCRIAPPVQRGLSRLGPSVDVLRATGTASPRWRAAMDALSAPPRGGLSGRLLPPGAESILPSSPGYPRPGTWGEEGAAEGSESITRGLRRQWGHTLSSAPRQPLLSKPAHADPARGSTRQLGTRVRTHAHTHTRATRTHATRLPATAPFLMLAPEVSVAGCSALLLLLGAWRTSSCLSWV